MRVWRVLKAGSNTTHPIQVLLCTSVSSELPAGSYIPLKIPVFHSDAQTVILYGPDAVLGQQSQAPRLPYIWHDLKGSDLGYGLWFVEFCSLQLLGNLISGKHTSKFCGYELHPSAVWLSQQAA